MDASMSRAARVAAIREFGPSRISEGFNYLNRKFGPECLNDEAQQVLLERLKADQELTERLARESREIYATHPYPASTSASVASARARQMEALISMTMSPAKAAAE